MNLRGLLRECREFPATISICLIWIAVFVAMAVNQHVEGAAPWTRWLFSGIDGGHRFGDLTLPEVASGQVWRLITCTFVHYSIIHIGLNLIAMYQLGTLVESWYGSPQFVFLYGLIAGIGNLIAILVRSYRGWSAHIHSGGGSVVILGLVGLCAIVGWRLRTRVGKLLYRQMVVVLVLTALLGMALPRYIDNWGHAGGAIAGALIGFAHPVLLRGVSKPRAWGAGILTALVIGLSGAAQAIADRREGPARLEAKAVRRVAKLDRLSRGLELVRRLGVEAGDPQQIRRILALLEADGDPRAEADLNRLRIMMQGSQRLASPSRDRQEFQAVLSSLLERVRGQYRQARRNLAEIRRPVEYRPRSAGAAP
jgi:rhomboid protease GluP